MDLYTMGTMLLNYATKGGMIAAGGAMLLISLASATGLLHRPPTDHLLVVLGNYFIIGALIGGLAGLVVILRDRQK